MFGSKKEFKILCRSLWYMKHKNKLKILIRNFISSMACFRIKFASTFWRTFLNFIIFFYFIPRSSICSSVIFLYNYYHSFFPISGNNRSIHSGNNASAVVSWFFLNLLFFMIYRQHDTEEEMKNLISWSESCNQVIKKISIWR